MHGLELDTVLRTRREQSANRSMSQMNAMEHARESEVTVSANDER